MKLFGRFSKGNDAGPGLRLAWRILTIASVVFTLSFLAFSLFSNLVLDRVEGVTKQIPQILAGAVNQPGQNLPAGSEVVLDGERVAVLENVVHTQTVDNAVGTIVTYRGTWTVPAEKVPASERQLVGVLASGEPTIIRLVSAAEARLDAASSRILLLSTPNRAYPVQTRPGGKVE